MNIISFRFGLKVNVIWKRGSIISLIYILSLYCDEQGFYAMFIE